MGTADLNHEREDAVARALDAMWHKFLPDIRHRVEVLALAAQAAAAGPLREEQRISAHAAAHKLAGSLGTFGLDRGTELARELEIRLSGSRIGPSQAPDLERGATELRAIIENRK